MKKTTNNLSKKIVSYGALTAAIAGFGNLAAQNVYTDIDPDVTFPIDDPAFPYDIDLDGDSNVDFTISLTAVTNGAAFIMFPQTSSNAFVGIAAGGYQYPANLSAGTVVSSGSPLTDQGLRGDLNYYGCAYSNSQFCGGEGYVGLKFDIAGATHYGWLRIENPADVSSVTIKDYGYNATPGAAVTTGDTTTAGVDDNVLSSQVNIYPTAVDAELTINNRSTIALNTATIYDVNGRLISQHDLNGLVGKKAINVANLSTGLYFVELASDNGKAVKKLIKK